MPRGIVADLLEDEFVTRPGADEPSISGAPLFMHTNLEAGKNEDRSLLVGGYVSFILIGLLLVCLLIGVLWPRLIALSGLRVMYLAVCVVALVGTLAATGIVVLVIGRRLTRRVSRLADVASRVSNGELDLEPIGDRGSDGVSLLARAMDDMIGTLLY